MWVGGWLALGSELIIQSVPFPGGLTGSEAPGGKASLGLPLFLWALVLMHIPLGVTELGKGRGVDWPQMGGVVVRELVSMPGGCPG